MNIFSQLYSEVGYEPRLHKLLWWKSHKPRRLHRPGSEIFPCHPRLTCGPPWRKFTLWHGKFVSGVKRMYLNLKKSESDGGRNRTTRVEAHIYWRTWFRIVRTLNMPSSYSKHSDGKEPDPQCVLELRQFGNARMTSVMEVLGEMMVFPSYAGSGQWSLKFSSHIHRQLERVQKLSCAYLLDNLDQFCILHCNNNNLGELPAG